MIELPASWRTTIEGWSWTILGVTIDIGGLLLEIIDWLLDKVNIIIEVVNRLADQFDDFKVEALEFIESLLEIPNIAINWLRDQVDSWWFELLTWWDATYRIVQDWVETRLISITETLSSIGDNVSNLWTSITNLWQTVSDGFLSRLDVEDIVRAVLFPYWDILRFLFNNADDIIDFFRDPLEWFYLRLDEFFERYW